MDKPSKYISPASETSAVLPDAVLSASEEITGSIDDYTVNNDFIW